uniref:NADH dehydrogenase subunit 2 n=1 Tax=Surirella sp. TaxID=1526603 RepID=A0A2R4A3I3_9STRA|nr:NADH dehydrogenase subunit 2 [Surirella sp.]
MTINILSLNSFSVYTEYFIGISVIYVLIILIILTGNVQGLLIQGIISEAFAIILLANCFLMMNEHQFCFKISNSQPINEVLFYYGLNTHILNDNVSSISKFILCFFNFIFFMIISEFFKRNILTFEFIILLFFAVLGLIFMCSSGDFILIFLSMELISLVSYLITSFRKKSIKSVESGVKYLVIGTIASSLFVLGVSFIYLFTGSFLISDYTILFLDLNLSFFVNSDYSVLLALENLINSSPASIGYGFNNSFLIEIGLFCVLISVFIKLGLAPFHLWLIDVYENAPTIATFFFSALTKFSFIVLLFRVSTPFVSYFYYFLSNMCLIISLTSILVGSFANLQQKKIKTFLAYSSINHMGFVILSLSFFKSFSLAYSLYYLIIYMLTNLLIWHVVLLIAEIKKNHKFKNSIDFSDFLLLNKSQPILAFGLLIGFCSSSGLPPFIGFFSKFQILSVLIEAKFFSVGLMVVICSIISTFYYIRILKILYFENVFVGKLYEPINSNKILIFCSLAFSLILLLIKPNLLYLIVYYFIIQFFSDSNIYYLF